MIFITGPLFSGKKEYIMKALSWTEEEFNENAVQEAQKLAFENSDIAALADELCQKAVIIADEVGGGVIPVDSREREARERAGRLCCLLAEKADTVIRVYMGIPQVLKGKEIEG